MVPSKSAAVAGKIKQHIELVESKFKQIGWLYEQSVRTSESSDNRHLILIPDHPTAIKTLSILEDSLRKHSVIL